MEPEELVEESSCNLQQYMMSSNAIQNSRLREFSNTTNGVTMRLPIKKETKRRQYIPSKEQIEKYKAARKLKSDQMKKEREALGIKKEIRKLTAEQRERANAGRRKRMAAKTAEELEALKLARKTKYEERKRLNIKMNKKMYRDYTPEQREKMNAKRRNSALTHPQREKRNALQRVSLKTPEQREKRNAAKRVSSMTPEQLQKKKEATQQYKECQKQRKKYIKREKISCEDEI